MDRIDRYLGCMLGGATGDALGFIIEFDSWATIKKKYGPYGLRTVLKLDVNTRRGTKPDDTQVARFTADGLLWALQENIAAAEGMYRSYMRWYYTQTKTVIRRDQETWMKRQPHEEAQGYDIMAEQELYARRAPGLTCMDVLSSGRRGRMGMKLNTSKGCGTVMRVAPVGLFYAGDVEEAFYVGCQSGVLTHGNPTGYLAAGTLSAIVSLVVRDLPFRKALQIAEDILKEYDHNEEVLQALARAREEAVSDRDPIASLERIGPGWVAEEALAAAVYCLLKTDTFKDAVIMACNHDGDSDSCGAVCGNIGGALYGVADIPHNWTSHLECSDLLQHLGKCLYEENGKRYPQ